MIRQAAPLACFFSPPASLPHNLTFLMEVHYIILYFRAEVSPLHCLCYPAVHTKLWSLQKAWNCSDTWNCRYLYSTCMALYIKGDSSIPGQNATSVLILLSLSQGAEMQTGIGDTLRTATLHAPIFTWHCKNGVKQPCK